MHYLKPYYIFNYLVILTYPLHRLLGFSSFYLQANDWIGYSRESTIITTFILFVCFRWKKYCTFEHFVMNSQFYAKVCFAALYYIAYTPYFFYYSLLTVTQWLIIKMPINRGLHNFVRIDSEEQFDELVIPPKRSNKNRQNTSLETDQNNVWFVECYVNFAETCKYTRGIWAEYSRKYNCNGLKFAEGIYFPH